MNSIMKHIYSEKIELGAYYTYDNNQKKIYDFNSMRQDLKALIKKLKRQH